MPVNWTHVQVCGFESLIAALERAKDKGYMPDALKEAWGNFQFKACPAADAGDGFSPNEAVIGPYHVFQAGYRAIQEAKLSARSPKAPAVEAGTTFEDWWECEQRNAKRRLEGDDWLDLDDCDKGQYEKCWRDSRAAITAPPPSTGPAPLPEATRKTPAVEAGADLLVTMTISVSRDGVAESDVQTHDNSYSEVAVGLSAVRDEINRVFAERKNCPYYPKNSEDANRKIVRSTEATRKAMGATPEKCAGCTNRCTNNPPDCYARCGANAAPPAASAQKGLTDWRELLEAARKAMGKPSEGELRWLWTQARATMPEGMCGFNEARQLVDMLFPHTAPPAASAQKGLPACKGMNCGSTDGVSHSLECQAEHAAAIAGGRFIKLEHVDKLAEHREYARWLSSFRGSPCWLDAWLARARLGSKDLRESEGK